MAKDSVSKMSGEAFPEISVLIFVLAILDKLVDGRITIFWTMATWLVSAVFFATGAYIERRSRDE
jgi:hypothetical protein